MSRHQGRGVHPKTGNPVQIAFGFDSMPGCVPGHFVQVYSNEKEDIEKCSSGEGIIVNEGFIDGITIERRDELLKEYKLDWENL